MITELRVHSIRVFDEVRMEFPQGIIVLLGENGTGKTTILESISVLYTLRSFRTRRLKEMHRNGCPSAVIDGVIDQHQLRVELKPSGKNLIKDGQKVSSMKAFCEGMTTITLAPEHQALLDGGPEETRRYLDQTLFSLNPNYLALVQNYHRALKHKQALLKAKLPFHIYKDQVLPWNQTMISTGGEIRELRKTLTHDLDPIVFNNFGKLAQSKGRTTLRYRESQDSMEEEIFKSSFSEYRSGKALFGPHRDCMEILFNGVPCHAQASQGERTAVLLALKLAELDILEERKAARPILLLDDVSTTLDEERRDQLFSKIGEKASQVLISTFDLGVCKKIKQIGGHLFRKEESLSPFGFSIARWIPA